MATWQDVSARKVSARDAAIPREWVLETPPAGGAEGDTGNVMSVPRTCGILSPAEVAITETPADVLVSRMVGGQLTSEAVTIAFCKRAAVAQQLVNCLTEIMFDDAIRAAKDIDAEFKRTGKPKGVLHGLPVSLKDNIDVKGYDSSTGLVNRVGDTATEDAALVVALRNAGAVFHCKTNVPTGMIMAESYNNVWGYTSNPHNRGYACGGSSGGEAALLALRGAPLGVGSDIAGSIRLPSAACGVYGLKPSTGRFSMAGMRNGSTPGQESVRGVTGPMAPDFSALELFGRAVVGERLWEVDPLVLEVPWRNVSVPSKLCFGMIVDDGSVRPTPAVARILRETRSALEAQGHTVIEWTPPPGGPRLLMKLLHGDGGAKLRAEVRGGRTPEPWPQGLTYYEKIYQRSVGKEPKVAELWDMQLERAAFLELLLKEWMKSKQVTGTGRAFDGVIAPVQAFPACRRYEFRYPGYCSLWNLADQTSVAFPAGLARRTDTGRLGEYRNAEERAVWENYDPEQLDGMPVGLQLVSTRHSEERALKVANVVVEAIEKSKARTQAGKL